MRVKKGHRPFFLPFFSLYRLLIPAEKNGRRPPDFHKNRRPGGNEGKSHLFHQAGMSVVLLNFFHSVQLVVGSQVFISGSNIMSGPADHLSVFILHGEKTFVCSFPFRSGRKRASPRSEERRVGKECRSRWGPQ